MSMPPCSSSATRSSCARSRGSGRVRILRWLTARSRSERTRRRGRRPRPPPRRASETRMKLARKRLAHRASADVGLADRFVSPGALAHNKFLVVTDASGKPKRLWTGSTNWTTTGLCTQLNNALLVKRRRRRGRLPEAVASRCAMRRALIRPLSPPRTARRRQSEATRRALARFGAFHARNRDASTSTELGTIVRAAQEGVLVPDVHPRRQWRPRRRACARRREAEPTRAWCR